MFERRLPLLLLLAALTGCEQVGELLELPNPQKEAAMAEAEGKAVGGACRQTGRSLEDCYALNPKARKSAVFAGWREMNDYMMQNNMEIVPSLVTRPNGPFSPPPESTQAELTSATAAPATEVVASGARRPRNGP